MSAEPPDRPAGATGIARAANPAGRARLTLRVGLALGLGGLGAAGCKVAEAPGAEADPELAGPFADTFDRTELGLDWRDTSGGAAYRARDGRLVAAGAHNHPLWLKRRLPRDVVIDVDVMSRSPAGDTKIEIFGDGKSFDPDGGSYVSTGYMLIFGGWHNTLDVICRNNEHDDGRKSQRSDIKVEPGRTYHWTVTRKGGAIDWLVDGKPFLAWSDPAPLAGPGHEHLAVNDWEAEVHYDNLRIRQAP